MKNNLLVATILTTLLSSNSFAMEKCASSAGNVIMQKVTVGCMSINGSATTNGTTFTGDVMITGPLKATNSNFSGVNVTGAVIMDKCQVTGDAHIIGHVAAVATTFQKQLTLNANEILLDGATTQNIIVESTTPSTLTLNDTNVEGDITFLYAQGSVVSNKSNIKGKIIQPQSLPTSQTSKL